MSDRQRKHKPIVPPSPPLTSDTGNSRQKDGGRPTAATTTMTKDRPKSGGVRGKREKRRSRSNVFRRLGGGGTASKQSTSTTNEPPRQKKKEVCRNYLRKGQCPYGNSCIYIHSRHPQREQQTSSSRDLRRGDTGRSTEKQKDRPQGQQPSSRNVTDCERKRRTENRERPSSNREETKANKADKGDNTTSKEFEDALRLEKKRQEIQRELKQLDGSPGRTVASRGDTPTQTISTPQKEPQQPAHKQRRIEKQPIVEKEQSDEKHPPSEGEASSSSSSESGSESSTEEKEGSISDAAAPEITRRQTPPINSSARTADDSRKRGDDVPSTIDRERRRARKTTPKTLLASAVVRPTAAAPSTARTNDKKRKRSPESYHPKINKQESSTSYRVKDVRRERTRTNLDNRDRQSAVSGSRRTNTGERDDDNGWKRRTKAITTSGISEQQPAIHSSEADIPSLLDLKVRPPAELPSAKQKHHDSKDTGVRKGGDDQHRRQDTSSQVRTYGVQKRTGSERRHDYQLSAEDRAHVGKSEAPNIELETKAKEERRERKPAEQEYRGRHSPNGKRADHDRSRRLLHPSSNKTDKQPARSSSRTSNDRHKSKKHVKAETPERPNSSSAIVTNQKFDEKSEGQLTPETPVRRKRPCDDTDADIGDTPPAKEPKVNAPADTNTLTDVNVGDTSSTDILNEIRQATELISDDETALEEMEEDRRRPISRASSSVPIPPDQLEDISDDEIDDLVAAKEISAAQALQQEWAALAKPQTEQPPTPEASTVRQRFKPSVFLRTVAFSKRLLGDALTKEIETVCNQDGGDRFRFEAETAATQRRAMVQRTSHYYTGVKGALSAREDLRLRRQLCGFDLEVQSEIPLGAEHSVEMTPEIIFAAKQLLLSS